MPTATIMFNVPLNETKIQGTYSMFNVKPLPTKIFPVFPANPPILVNYRF